MFLYYEFLPVVFLNHRTRNPRVRKVAEQGDMLREKLEQMY